MSDDEKAKLYRTIVQRTDDHFWMERMRFYGFWPDRENPAEDAAERKALEAELALLRQQHSAVKNPEQALVAERKRRWEESKARRQEAKKARLEKEKQRREAYAAIRKSTIVHAGEGVSGGLENDRSDLPRLVARSLPIMQRSEDLAQQMGIALESLRWLTYHRRGATVVHYHRYDIAKRPAACVPFPRPGPARAQAQHSPRPSGGC